MVVKFLTVVNKMWSTAVWWSNKFF